MDTLLASRVGEDRMDIRVACYPPTIRLLLQGETCSRMPHTTWVGCTSPSQWGPGQILTTIT